MTSTQRPSQKLWIATGAALAVTAGVGCYLWAERRRRATSSAVRVRVLYGSTTGGSAKWAQQVGRDLRAQCGDAEVLVEDLTTFSFDALLEVQPGRKDVVVILLSTHTDGVPPESCAHFCTLLDDHVHDFRVDKTAFSHLSFAVLGFGSTDYQQAGHYCTAAQKVDAGFAALAARRLLPFGRVTDTRDADAQVLPWLTRLQAVLKRSVVGGGAVATEVVDPNEAAAAEEDAGEGESDSDSDTTTAGSDAEPSEVKGGSDVEDVADSCAGTVASSLLSSKTKEKREMVTKRHREQLTKEGYKIVGSHSAVKLCRWTKHQLRGRGGCYKHSFYGITSYQCMEATPSLACANKCVFCWRHHKNPTGTEWKWKMDEPDMIVEQGIEQHRRMIRECKGIPGVKKDRFEEAMTVRHCALSLVGEPIMYPRINELLTDLHSRRISTFLVTNAQFPEAIHNLVPVTQLYVSVDAGTPEALKAVDRPIFTDFWDRYVDSLKALADKKQRTTYRLTLVKDHNMSDCGDYAKLVALGQPDFIEIKSVTFCGESKASNLTISNTPWHEEVKEFAEAMLSHCGLADDYEMSCEHQHSCIVLISHKKFKIGGKWHTWINYDRFHDLVAEGRQFSALDYCLETPEWALYGSDEHGFDPKETRVFHNRTKKKAKEGLLSEAQLRQYGNQDPLAEVQA